MTRLCFRVGALFALALGWTLPPALAAPPPKPKEPPFPPPGMVSVPAGPFKMGVDQKWLERQFHPTSKRKWNPLLTGPNADFFWWSMMLETPEHEVVTDAYAIDRFCVTNAQYLEFLDDTCKSTQFISGTQRSITDIGKALFGKDVEESLLSTIYYLNAEKLNNMKVTVLATNKERVDSILKAFNVGRPAGAQVPDFDGLPEKDRVAAWVRFDLPPDTALLAYSRRIPATWPKGRVTPEIADWPVTDVTALDAEDFAAWAGRHVPTEAEWEKAARGPKDWLWPWAAEWNWLKERNLLYWREANTTADGGPAPAARDHPIPVDALPAGQSGYGCFQMLGNVMQWTSTPPELYPKSDAKAESWFGKPQFRVIRGSSYGEAYTPPKEGPDLLIRNTRRIVIEFKGRGSGVGMHYSMLGFRCAKYPEPTRDVMMQQLAKLEERRAVPLDPAAAKNGVRFDASRAYGVELDRYAPPGSEGKGKVFVTGATKIVSFVPVEHLPFSTVKHLVAAQEAERKSPDELPVILGLLTWNADLAIDIVEMVEQQPAAPEQVPGPGEEPDGKGADGGAKTPDAPAEKPKPGVDKPRNTDDKPKAGGDKPKPAGDKPKPGGEKAKEGGEKPGPGPAAPPAGPTIVPTRTFLPADVSKGFLLGLDKGQLVLFRKVPGSYKLVGIFPPVNEEDAKTPVVARIEKGSPKAFKPSSAIDPETGIVTLRLSIPTSSSMTDDVFSVQVKIRVKGDLSGDWRVMKD